MKLDLRTLKEPEKQKKNYKYKKRSNEVRGQFNEEILAKPQLTNERLKRRDIKGIRVKHLLKPRKR